EQLAEVGLTYKPFDRRHTPNSNWPRIPGIHLLYRSTAGIIGLGEIGAELALRTTAFGMRTLYYQRTRLPEDEERRLNVTYASFEQVLSESDWVFPILPTSPSTRGLIDQARFALMKPGAMLVNISRADVVDRAALLEALRSRRLARFPLHPPSQPPAPPPHH